MLRRFWLWCLIPFLGSPLVAQTSPTPLEVTRIFNVTSAWPGECGANAVDNRSVFARQNDYHGVLVTSASGIWSVSLSYSDTSCSGPWTTFGAGSTLNQGTTPPLVAFGFGNHSFIQIAITGNAVVTYTASKQYYPPPAVNLTGNVLTSFNGRCCSIIPLAGDYTIAQITNGVGTNQSNTYTAPNDFSAATIKVPMSAGFTANANANVGIDTTNNNLHFFNGSIDGVSPLLAGAFTTGHCVQVSGTSPGSLTLIDSGSANCGGGGSISWNNISNPGGNQALAMNGFTTTWTFGNATIGNLFTITDSTNNTGTGYAVFVNLASGSGVKPAEFAVNGNGFAVSNLGVAAPVGTGHINADWINGVVVPTSATVLSSNSSNQLVAAATSGSGAVALVNGPVFLGTVTAAALTMSGTLTLSSLNTVTQCLHVSSFGVVSGTGQDCGAGGGSGAWSALTNATGNLTLANAGFTTTFNQTSGVNWTWANTTAATSGANQSSPVFNLNGTYWTGAASATDSWTWQDIAGTGTNPTSTLTFGHSGSSGVAAMQVPQLVINGGSGAGALMLTQGTAQTAIAASVGIQAPATVTTPYFFTVPGAPAAGLVRASGANPNVLSITEISGDCSTSGSLVITCTRLNGVSFSGTNGNLVSFGAANAPADSGIAGANVVTLAGNQTLTTKTLTNPSLGVDSNPSAITQRYTADTAGTTANLVCKISSNDHVVTALSTDSEGVGICQSTQSSGASVEVAVAGTANCIFDNTAVANDFVQMSVVTGGQCHDAGATAPTSGGVIVGKVTQGGAAATGHPVQIEMRGGSGGGSTFTGSTAISCGTGATGCGGANATPTYSLADVSVKSPVLFTVNPTVSITGVTFTAKTAGARFAIRITTDGTHTWAWGPGVADQVCPVFSSAIATTVAKFIIDPDGTTVHGDGCLSGIGNLAGYGSYGSAATVNPGAGNTDCRWTANGLDCLIGTQHYMQIPTGVDVSAAGLVTNLHLTNPVNLGGGATQGFVTHDYANDTTTGTAQYALATLNGNDRVVTMGASAVDGVIGICYANCGNSGTSQVAISGEALCKFAVAPTVGHFVQVDHSGSNPGFCIDAGATRPGTNQIVGFVANAAATFAPAYLVKLELGSPSGGGGGGTGNPYTTGITCSSSPTTITAATHGQGVYPFVRFTDANGFAARAGSMTLASNGDLTVTCNVTASITIWVSGAAASHNNVPYPFTASSSVVVAGQLHDYGNPYVKVQAWDNGSPRNWIVPGSVSVDATTFNVTTAFSSNVTGLLVLAAN